MLPIGLNHMTAPTLSVQALFDLATKIGCVGVEFRNDLGRPLFDGQTPETVREIAHAANIRILALAEVKAFNDAPDDKTTEALHLMQLAVACGAEGVALIPRVATSVVDRKTQRDALHHALTLYRPMLEDLDLIGLIEPLGFTTSTLRHKDDAAAVLSELGNPACFKLVHDTFHHHLSGDTAFHANLTGLVHISGIADPAPVIADMTDAHRVLVDANDRLGNITQLQTLAAHGYTGPASFECFAPQIHNMTDPSAALAGSVAFITSEMRALGA